MNENPSSVSVLEPVAKPQVKPPSPLNNNSSPASDRQGFASWLLQSIPTALVLALLIGLAIWGHNTGWKFPKFSELAGNGKQEQDNWCKEHPVPESECVECNKKLMPRIDSTWCRTHGVHNCPFERTDVAQLKEPVKGTKEDLKRAERALALKDRPENNSKCKLHHRLLQFASADVLDKMGVEHTYSAWRGRIVETVTASGEVAFEQPRVAPIGTPVAGRVWLVTDKGQLGIAVERGDVLALVDATEVGKAKAEFLQAFAQLDLRTKTLESIKPAIDMGAIPATRLNEYESAKHEAEIRLMGAQQALVNIGLPVSLTDVKSMSTETLSRYLQFFGIPQTISSQFDAKTMSFNLFPILATRKGVVTEAKVVPGEPVDSSKPLFVVTDASQMRLHLSVRNEDVKYVRTRDNKTGKPGQSVIFRPDGSDQEITAELIGKSTKVDEKTRTVQFWADLPNPDGSLLANTFGMAQIVLREEKDAIVIPTEALHWEGDCNIVFVRDKNFLEPGAPKVFHVRTVRPGVRNGASTEIIAGLLPGEIVATRNSGNLRAELLKNNLGAG